MKKIGILIVLLFSLGCSSQSAKLSKAELPVRCQYLLDKTSAIIVKKDVECYAQYASIQANKKLPMKIDRTVTMTRQVAKKSKLIHLLDLTNIDSVKNIGKKRWNDFHRLLTEQITKKYCSASSPHIFMINNGLVLQFVFTNRTSNDKLYVTVNKKSCLKY